MRPHRLFAIAAVLSTGFAAHGARADATPTQIATARELGKSGVAAAQSGDCVTAVDKLSHAEELYHAPTTAEPLGECQVKLGKIVAGTEVLAKLVHEQLPPNASPLWVAAQDKAREVLAQALPRVAKLRVHVERPAGAPPPTVTVDGEPLAAAMLDAERPTDPGTRTVRATAPGCLAAEAMITLQDGDARAITVTLEPDPNATREPPPAAKPSVAPPRRTPPRAPEPRPVEPAPASRVPAYVSLGAGVLGLGVGAIFGGLALGAQSHLNNACTNKVCPASSQSDIDAMHTDALVSTVGFGLGVVGLAVGGYLLFTAPSSARTTGVAPYVGPGSAGIAGRFE